MTGTERGIAQADEVLVGRKARVPLEEGEEPGASVARAADEIVEPEVLGVHCGS